MKVVNRPRGSGKTLELIKMCAESNGYIVCRNRDMVYQIAKTAKHLGLDINFPMTYSEFLEGNHGPFVRNLHIDDVDALLQRLSPRCPILSISVTGEDES